MFGSKRRKQDRQDAQRYFWVMSDLHEAFRWLDGEAAEVIQWILEMHRDKWRALNEPPVSKLPSSINDFRNYLYAKRDAKP